ncbi:MAG: tRNA (guanosine(37)-N1)-methyltransferase TrmD [Candidatus Colwellbacteria bacterium CG10_big_fil_rev_8_21_14_0_10_42_22]|uniref:tRNA (guanine-N(1)-)-methyltransferase n=1 Tax=Candidatus Colwellbacteria bacterium CG10_big_fil_rev_8_21_14_0_10_42_22 TaxID=1974540 RepID=A0A2H0VF60_9BACT|nr:MAG: tRNA (guanosine(37)-N1)-methyltransferase TrmD [Candidatus Colwellbacteria bacterium CG10_big_fil_rev_8_21_14_0_10_42_22]
MTFHILTIFPEVIEPYFKESVLGKAFQKGIIKIKLYNLRDFANDKHKKVDDKAYGGGPGMVVSVEPLMRAIEYILKGKPKNSVKILLTDASGKQFNNKIASQLAKSSKHLIIIAGRYEGIDERVIRILKSKKGLGLSVEKISVGPYVLTGGEVPAMVIVDAISRQIKGVLGKEFSLEERRLGVGVPVFTRPEVYEYKDGRYSVPKELVSGNHKKIEEWRKKHRRA